SGSMKYRPILSWCTMTAPPGSPPMKPSIWPARRAAAPEGELPTAMTATSPAGSRPAALRSPPQARSVALPARVLPSVGPLEAFDVGGGKVLAHHEEDRVAVQHGDQVLGSEALLGEDHRPLHVGAGEVDGAADHGRGHLGAALEVRELGGQPLPLEVAE